MKRASGAKDEFDIIVIATSFVDVIAGDLADMRPKASMGYLAELVNSG